MSLYRGSSVGILRMELELFGWSWNSMDLEYDVAMVATLSRLGF